MRAHHLSLKDMPQMTTTFGTGDLHPAHAIGIVHMALHCARDLCIERWPAASRVKLGL